MVCRRWASSEGRESRSRSTKLGFVPKDAPYAYTAGPDGIDILEFRNVSAFDMQITESLPRWDRIVETVRANKDAWAEGAPRA